MSQDFRSFHLFCILKAYEAEPIPLDRHLRNYLREHKAIGSKDRRWISDTLYTLVRWRGLLDHLAPKPLSWEGRLSCLRTLKPEQYLSDLSLAAHLRVSFPKWLFSLLEQHYGSPTALELCAVSNQMAPTMLRVNLLKTTREDLLKKWAGIYPVQPAKHSPWGIEIFKKMNFAELDEFKAGLFEVQDEASQLIAQLVAATPGQKVLDFCAGAAGKTLAFAPGMQNKGIIYLHDVRASILKEAKKRLGRAGVHNVQILPARCPMKMDWILIDTPCSGTGTLRRNPDLKWKLDAATLERLVHLQREIVQQALPLLAPEGKIVYATCSLLPEENEAQIDYFEKNFKLSLCAPPFRSVPTPGGMDGFFGAILKKGSSLE